MKFFKLMIFLCILVFAINSCVSRTIENKYSVTEKASTILDDIPGVSETSGNIESLGSPVPIYKINIVEYINPLSVSEYYNLTQEQQIAFRAICDALSDIIDNGPTPYKNYILERPIPWVDYKVAYNLIDSNYAALEDIISILYSNTSHFFDGAEYVDSFYLDGYNVDFIEKEYSKFMESNSKAENILLSLEYDGTTYGKAHSIAKWMVENITYAHDYAERLEDGLNTVHTTLMTNEAVCDGYAKTYDFLCKRAGLETIYVVSNDSSHAWNMICIDNKWYHIDITWMDHPNVFYKYFMMSDETCKYTGHPKWEYYWDQRNNVKIVPIAGYDDLYFYIDIKK